MEEEASIIEIDSTYGAYLIIDDRCLGMDKTRGVFIYLHTRFEQDGIEASAYAVDDFLIRNPWHYDSHIDTTGGGTQESIKKLIP